MFTRRIERKKKQSHFSQFLFKQKQTRASNFFTTGNTSQSRARQIEQICRTPHPKDHRLILVRTTPMETRIGDSLFSIISWDRCTKPAEQISVRNSIYLFAKREKWIRNTYTSHAGECNKKEYAVNLFWLTQTFRSLRLRFEMDSTAVFQFSMSKSPCMIYVQRSKWNATNVGRL